MAKRFIDTEIWLKNKWFRLLKPKYKLFWFYLISNCDSVGVWEEDVELASYAIQCKYEHKEILKVFGHKIKVFSNNEKWWIKDFIDFQYGILRNNSKNKPHESYKKLLKKHRLWIDYEKTIHTLKDKEKEKEKEKEEEKSAKNSIWDKLSKKYLKATSLKRKKKPSIKKWGNRLRTFCQREEIKKTRVKKVLLWYCSQFDKNSNPYHRKYLPKYVPQANSMSGFCNKFHDIERAMLRITKDGFDPDKKSSIKVIDK